ncbi:4-coumarate--CoA ligase like [Zostera marina]|uniref:4-coumarate--CoA ligase n=1 Tax=Zostera marina TaxID=29655 RepID=A0A0K9NPG9_ZOSMR|nr:4-coumarate--CoA ligase like [Zostera marina]
MGMEPALIPEAVIAGKQKSFSLRPKVPLPPETQNLSAASYAISTLLSVTPSNRFPSRSAFIDSSTSKPVAISFPEFFSQVSSLSSALRHHSFFSFLSKGQIAFVLSPTKIEIPVVYLALIAVGVIVSPSNPASTPQEIEYQINLTCPSIIFVTSTAHLLPPNTKNVIHIDSAFFKSLLTYASQSSGNIHGDDDIIIPQSHPAFVLYSSGTTGRMKAVVITNRNLISMMANTKARYDEEQDMNPQVLLLPLPLFHVFGLSMMMRCILFGDTIVLMNRFDFIGMLRNIEQYLITLIPVSPLLIVAMVKLDLVAKFNLSSLESVACGGAPLGRDLTSRFASRFPKVSIYQGYGFTESTAAVTTSDRREETLVYGSAGRLLNNLEAKIVDPVSGVVLGPGQPGELWLRGPTIMAGYLGDEKATKSTLDSEGWLKTGDLCKFDDDGFLFVVDRLKELIKYKGYQVPPAELEHILHSHPEIDDAAVIPYPDEDAGEIPMAYVVKQPQ